MRRTTGILMVGVLVLGLYVLPSVTARFAGSHTWELNRTAGVVALKCTSCHMYISLEIQSSSDDVFYGHWNASENWNDTYEGTGQEVPFTYLGDNGIVNVSGTNIWPQGMKLCLMCHIVENQNIGIYGGHTRTTIRACTDGDCHGEHKNPTVMSNKVYDFGQTVNITAKLNSSSDAHKNFYRPLSEKASNYTMEDTTDTKDTTDDATYSAGFLACLGCHTHVGVQMQIQRPNIYKFNMSTTDGVSWSVPEAPTANNTNFTTVISYGSSGAKWR